MFMTEKEYKALISHRTLSHEAGVQLNGVAKSTKKARKKHEEAVARKESSGLPTVGGRETGRGAAMEEIGGDVNTTTCRELAGDTEARKKKEEQAAARASIRNGRSLNRGKSFERMIEEACGKYEERGVALILKTPEPFIVLNRNKEGIFTGRFTGTKAQPDFQGTLSDGRSILIEAKSTEKDRIMQSALTETQTNLLDKHDKFGAVCLVAVNIQDHYFSIPWKVWKGMKKRYGHKYATVEELTEFEITPGEGGVLFDFLKLGRDVN